MCTVYICRPNALAAFGTIVLMVPIELTGNFGTFNLVTVLCTVFLLDDATLRIVNVNVEHPNGDDVNVDRRAAAPRQQQQQRQQPRRQAQYLRSLVFYTLIGCYTGCLNGYVRLSLGWLVGWSSLGLKAR